MRLTYRFIALVASLSFASSAIAQTVAISYGQSSNGSLFFRPDGSTLTDTGDVMILGNFSSIPGSSAYSDWLSAFTPLNGGGDEASTFAMGLASGSVTVNSTGIDGTQLYLLILQGSTSFANASGATGFAVVRDSIWGTVPVGSSPIPTSYNIRSSDFDTVLIGSEFTHNVGGMGQGIQLMAIPEPSATLLVFPVLGLLMTRRNRK